MPSPSLGTVLERIGQTQTPLPAPIAVAIGLAAFGASMAPSLWMITRYVHVMAHEGAHALAGSGTGWKVRAVILTPGGNGSTDVGPPGGLGFVIIGIVGYLGPSAFGLGAAKLISLGHSVAVLWLGLLFLALLLVTVRNKFGIGCVIVTGLLVYLVARYATVGADTAVAYVIAWFLLISGVRAVLEHGRNAGDAGNLYQVTHVRPGFWSLVWLAGTVVALLAGGALLV